MTFASRVTACASLLLACGFDSSGQTGSGSASVGSADDTTTTTGADDGSSTLSGAATSATTSMTTEVDTTATATGPDPDTTGDETTVGTETTAGDTTTAGEGLACPQLLWVGAAEMASGTDVPLVERAQAIGFEITFVLDSASLASDADGQCAVVISGTADSVDVVDRFHDVLVPVITWEYGIYDDMDFVAAGLEGVAEATNAIDVLDPAHPLAAGYPAGMLAIFTGTGRIGYAMGTGAHVVAALPGQPTTATLFEYQPGEILADGSDATGLRIALPIMSAPEGTLEPAGIDLFEAALRRATQP